MTHSECLILNSLYTETLHSYLIGKVLNNNDITIHIFLMIGASGWPSSLPRIHSQCSTTIQSLGPTPSFYTFIQAIFQRSLNVLFQR